VGIAADGTLDWSRAKPGISEYDPVAIEVARQHADSVGAELVGISVGSPEVASSLAKKAALSRGLDRVVLVGDDELAEAGSTLTGQVIAATVRFLGDVDLVFTGDSSVDMGAHLVPSTIGGALGWPVVTEVLRIANTPDGLIVTQVMEGGVRELKVGGPCVIAVTSDAAVPKIPGMREILAAGKKPAVELPLAELGLPPSGTRVEQLIASRIEPPPRGKRVITHGDSTATEVVAWLREQAVLKEA
jgi:electron transfer flavoprotein beta subunit